MKILAIALSGIGDALLFSPAVKVLREKYPDSSIDVLAMYRGVKDIYSRVSQIDRVIYHDFLHRNNFANLFFVLGLRNKYDVTFSVYPSNRWHYTLISFLIGAPIRLGVRYNHKDLQNLGFLNNRSINENLGLHNVEENLKLVELLTNEKISNAPSLILNLSPEDYSYAENFLIKNGINQDQLVIGFHPGCSTLKNHINRRWSPDKFAALARKLIDELDARVLLFGGPDEQKLKEGILNRIQSQNAINVITENLAQTAAIMKKTKVFVTNDSSLMHVAAALQLKVVAIIGPTNENFIRPWKTEHQIASLNLDCSPCFFYSPKPLTCSRSDVEYKCVVDLDENLVYEKINMLLTKN